MNIEQAYRELRMPFRHFLVKYVLSVFLASLLTIILLWMLFPDIISGYLLFISSSSPSTSVVRRTISRR